jgi:predicted nucleic acid-binding protein
VTRLLIDSSVLIKWFHSAGEGELLPARALRSAHTRGDVEGHMLDLAMYEVGNVLIRALGWDSKQVADQLDDLHEIFGPPLIMTPEWLREAARLAQLHALSFYDASWAAAASRLGVPLVSADRQLSAAGLAESPAALCSRLRIAVEQLDSS